MIAATTMAIPIMSHQFILATTSAAAGVVVVSWLFWDELSEVLLVVSGVVVAALEVSVLGVPGLLVELLEELEPEDADVPPVEAAAHVL
jgi:hypothetical protein